MSKEDAPYKKGLNDSFIRTGKNKATTIFEHATDIIRTLDYLDRTIKRKEALLSLYQGQEITITQDDYERDIFAESPCGKFKAVVVEELWIEYDLLGESDDRNGAIIKWEKKDE
jgi:hypothetical protein